MSDKHKRIIEEISKFAQDNYGFQPEYRKTRSGGMLVSFITLSISVTGDKLSSFIYILSQSKSVVIEREDDDYIRFVIEY